MAGLPNGRKHAAVVRSGRPLTRNRPDVDRDATSSRLMRYRDQNGQDWADIIDFLMMHPEARRQVVRVLGELDALH